MEIKNIEDLKKVFLSLPDETLREYETSIVSIGLSSKVKKFDNWIHNLKTNPDLQKLTVKDLIDSAEVGDDSQLDDWLDSLMGNPNEDFTNANDDRIGFAAFATKLERLRRNQNFSKEVKLLNDYTRKYKKNHPLFSHLQLLCWLNSESSPSDDVLLSLAEQNKNNMPNHVGVIHCFAYTVAEILENPTTSDELKSKWLPKGLEAVEEALVMEDKYAKFYSTRARLLALSGKYEEAHNDIKRAIDLEDSSKDDYALRIDYYRTISEQISQRKESENIINELKSHVNDVHDKLNKQSHENLVKNMEFLGLFAGIVSFTIGGISIAVSGFKALEAAGLIIVLMGALLGVFAGFGAILHGFKKKQGLRNLIVFLTAIIILVIGVILLLQ